MAVQINTYGGLKAGVLAWLARSGDSLLDSRFDDFLLNCERRIYYGFAADDPANPLRSDPLRIVDMETVDPAFALSAVTPQPATFLELISAQLNSPNAPLQIVSQRTIDGYGSSTPDQPRLIAVSGTSFRVFPNPGSGAFTATLRYYQKLATPAGATVNAILTASPDVYSTAAWSRPRSSPRMSRARCATSRSTTPASRASMHARNASPPRRCR